MIEGGIGPIEDNGRFLGRQKASRGDQVFGNFDARAGSLRNSIEEIGPRGCELVATDEPTVVAKPFIDPAVVEDGEGNRRFPDPAFINARERPGLGLLRGSQSF